MRTARSMTRRFHAALLALSGAVAVHAVASAQAPAPSTGQRYGRLLIRNANVIDGTGNPTRGPFDILVQGNTIVAIQASRPAEFSGSSIPGERQISQSADRVIDGTGMTVMPGIIDVHAHIQFSRGGKAMPKDYAYKLWLAHGITTIRDPGSTEASTRSSRTRSCRRRTGSAHRRSFPTRWRANTPDERTPRQAAQAAGAAGLKVFINRPDVWEAIADEAGSRGCRSPPT
jgi:imidazolonepropionase-like amidohydrolase